jgi:hypothetical protein
MIRLLAALIVASLAAEGLAGQLASSAPRPSIVGRSNYIDWLNSRPLPAGQANATRWYASAFTNLRPMPRRDLLERASSAPWTELAEVAEWLERNARSLQWYRRGTEAPAFRLTLRAGEGYVYGPVWAEALLFARMPGLGAFELCADGWLAKGWRQWEQGDRQALFDHALVNLAACHHLASASPLVARMEGAKIAEGNYRAILRALATAETRDEIARSLAPRLDEADAPVNTLEASYDYQRLVAWDTLQRLYLPGDRGVVSSAAAVVEHLQKTAGRHAGEWQQFADALAAVGFSESVEEANQFFDALAAWNNRPPHEALEHLEEIAAAGRALKNPVIRLLVTDLTEPRRKMIRVETLRRGTHLVAHLLRHRAEYEALPESIDALGGARGVATVRVDPYSGKDFLYFRTREDFILYSVGADAKDDAGRPYLPRTEAGDLLIWPVR